MPAGATGVPSTGAPARRRHRTPGLDGGCTVHCATRALAAAAIPSRMHRRSVRNPRAQPQLEYTRHERLRGDQAKAGRDAAGALAIVGVEQVLAWTAALAVAR